MKNLESCRNIGERMMKKLFFAFIILIIIVINTSCLIQNQQQDDDGIDNNDNTIIDIENEEPEPSYEEKIISGMSLDEKVGQLVIIGFLEDTSEETLKKIIEKDKIGGFILFRRNYTSFKELYDLNSLLKKLNKDNPLPLLIAVDEEGGTVSRIPKEGVTMPDANVFGRINDLILTERSGEIIGKQLYSAGINMNFAPVLDILSRSDNALLKRRSYGKDKDIVSAHGVSFIKGLKAEGVIAVPKHFPGHGNTNIDSHNGVPVIDIDKNTMINREIVPFKYAIDKGADAMMIGHLVFPNIDDSGKPVTRSEVFLKEILRKELGFKGVSISDDIEMYAFSSGAESIEDAVIESFNAGIDVFVVGHTKEIQERTLNALKNGIINGQISEERLNETLKRIIELKKKYNLSNNMNLDYEEAYKLFTDDKYRNFVETIKNR